MSLFGGEMMINLCFVYFVYRFFMDGQPSVLFVFTRRSLDAYPFSASLSILCEFIVGLENIVADIRIL